MTKRILVWDRATRIFHWSLVASFTGAYFTSDSDYRVFHVMFGYTMLGLLLFRLLWGLIGPRYARFTDFIHGPMVLLRYLKSLFSKHPIHYVGHNPAGALAVVLLILSGLAVTVTGLLSYDEQRGEEMALLHLWITNFMLVLVGFHILGALVSSLLHRENLVLAMLTGYKDGAPEHAIRRKSSIVALLLLGAIAAFWYFGIPAGPVS